MKKQKSYRITVEEIDTEGQATCLQFEIEDREDIFAVVEAVKKGSDLDEIDATRVALALRLLAPTMVKHKKHPLFETFMPHFKDFMMNLKKILKTT